LNAIIKNWNSIYKPLSKKKKETLKAAKLNKVKGATLLHVIKGLPIYMVATTKDITVDKMKSSIKVNISKPSISITGAAGDIVEIS